MAFSGYDQIVSAIRVNILSQYMLHHEMTHTLGLGYRDFLFHASNYDCKDANNNR
jgi:hypothetical protein